MEAVSWLEAESFSKCSNPFASCLTMCLSWFEITQYIISHHRKLFDHKTTGATNWALTSGQHFFPLLIRKNSLLSFLLLYFLPKRSFISFYAVTCCVTWIRFWVGFELWNYISQNYNVHLSFCLSLNPQTPFIWHSPSVCIGVIYNLQKDTTRGLIHLISWTCKIHTENPWKYLRTEYKRMMWGLLK